MRPPHPSPLPKGRGSPLWPFVKVGGQFQGPLSPGGERQSEGGLPPASTPGEVGGDGVVRGVVARHIFGEGRAEVIVALGVVGVAGGLELG
jgi:hypothetical protein